MFTTTSLPNLRVATLNTKAGVIGKSAGKSWSTPPSHREIPVESLRVISAET
ncbi:hypothetical protein D515_01965 [Grimontia indica]|uniref:Uncharacterized protein n=1 Tax=Grimontia indica TaxID=1056512 RepID=R1IEW2_9GAMM|nr:hypothetical protein D515_01965 [Grimontia indica]